MHEHEGVGTCNVIGPGRAGGALARWFVERGLLRVQDVCAGSAASAEVAVGRIGAGNAVACIADMRPASMWLVATPDRAIDAACAGLAAAQRIRPGDIVFHLSGATRAEVLAPLRGQGALIASVHPVKSFSGVPAAAATFAGTWCTLEGDAAAVGALAPLFRALGGHIATVDPAKKRVYHAGAVFACNYLAALAEAAFACCEEAGFSRADARDMLAPIMRETFDNVLALGPALALTGPIARGDVAVVERQAQALAALDPPLAALYARLGEVALRLARRNGTAAGADLDAIEAALRRA
jgi:predicted short-subunit dehydrogenase-like oxidoreductase (DUF2520 family)